MRKKRTSQSDLIKEVETFIRRYKDLDYVVFPEAGEMMFEGEEGESCLSDFLAGSISTYEEKRDIKSAIYCSYCINKALACGVIKTGEGLISKNEACSKKTTNHSKENEILKKKLEEVNRELNDAKKRIKELEKLMTPSFIGGVE